MKYLNKQSENFEEEAEKGNNAGGQIPVSTPKLKESFDAGLAAGFVVVETGFVVVTTGVVAF